jgi:hypothetical protein
LARVIPGVEVKVVKEIIPPPAYPSGTVALIGTAEKGPELTPVHLGSWREFADTFGAGANVEEPGVEARGKRVLYEVEADLVVKIDVGRMEEIDVRKPGKI